MPMRHCVLSAVLFSLAIGLLHAGAQDSANPDYVGERQNRALRWKLIFDTANGEDYAMQLAFFDAIIAVPEKDEEFRVFRNLKQRPIKGEVEDLKKIKRIFWVDDRPDSVKPLALALGLPDAPRLVVAFFPEPVEQEMVKLEQDFAQRAGRKVQDIAETRFRVVKKGEKYVIAITDQRAR